MLIVNHVFGYIFKFAHFYNNKKIGNRLHLNLRFSLNII
jgi:hypothetical protein